MEALLRKLGSPLSEVDHTVHWLTQAHRELMTDTQRVVHVAVCCLGGCWQAVRQGDRNRLPADVHTY